MAKAGDATKASIGSISESLAIAGPIFKQLNVPMEDATAQIALLQHAGLDASSTGTTLAATYSKLAAPMGQTKTAMSRLGLSVKDAVGNMKPPATLMNVLASTGKIKGHVGQMAAFTNLVGLESQKALLNIASAAKDGRLPAFVSDLKMAGDYADKISAKRLDNFTGDMAKLRSAVEGVSIKLFDMESGPLRNTVQRLTEWVRVNDELVASGIGDFIATAVPAVQNFADGMKDAFEDSTVIAGIKGVTESVGGLFGLFNKADGPRMQAYLWGKDIARIGIAIGGIAVVAKTASGAVWAFGAVTKGAKVIEWTWELGKATKGAVQAFRVARQVGPGSIVALGQAMNGATPLPLGLAQQTQGLAGWFDTVAKKAGLAAFAISTVYAAYDQGQAFLNENGGWEGFKGFFGIGTTDFGFEGIDQVMNRRARVRAAAEGRLEPSAPFVPAGDAIDKLFGVPGTVGPAGYFDAPRSQDGPSPAAPQLQVASPWDGFAPGDMRDLFKGSIDVNLKDPGNVVDSVEVKNPGKTLGPVNPRSGRN